MLYELDQKEDLHDHLTSLYIPGIAMDGERKRFFEDLVGIMEILRSPDGVRGTENKPMRVSSLT